MPPLASNRLFTHTTCNYTIPNTFEHNVKLTYCVLSAEIKCEEPIITWWSYLPANITLGIRVMITLI
jgi:hypothetical protein